MCVRVETTLVSALKNPGIGKFMIYLQCTSLYKHNHIPSYTQHKHSTIRFIFLWLVVTGKRHWIGVAMTDCVKYVHAF